MIAGPRRGPPLLTPAPGSLPGVDEVREGVSLYRVCAAGRLEGRLVAEGTLVMIARRRPCRGETLLVAEPRALRLCVAGAAGREGPGEEGRILGVVEAMVAEGAGRGRAA